MKHAAVTATAISMAARQTTVAGPWGKGYCSWRVLLLPQRRRLWPIITPKDLVKGGSFNFATSISVLCTTSRGAFQTLTACIVRRWFNTTVTNSMGMTGRSFSCTGSSPSIRLQQLTSPTRTCS
uniref:Putative secreted protein n=1 Tax=Ixodes ricinus TaxID=34613 RepID=A0A6B0UNU5_IXORI